MEIILGRASANRSLMITQRLKALKDCDEAVLIVPEQFTYQTERELLLRMGTHSVTNVTVISLSRLAQSVIAQSPYKQVKSLTGDIRNVLIKYAIKKSEPHLGIFAKSANKAGFAALMAEFITDLKKNSVGADELLSLTQNTSNDRLKNKLCDMSIIYRAYNELVGSESIDPDDIYKLAAKYLNASEVVKDKYVIFDNFYSFDKNSLELLGEILTSAKDTCFSLVCDESDEFFSITQTTKNILTDLAQSKGKETLVVRCDETLQKSESLIYLEKNYTSDEVNPAKCESGQINLSVSPNPEQEVITLADNITKLIRNDKCRYNEMSIVVSDFCVYSGLISDVFNSYNIPFFMDTGKKIATIGALRALLFLFDTLKQNVFVEDILNFMKTGFGGVDCSEASIIENYSDEFGLNAEMFFKDFTANNSDCPYDLVYLNDLRSKTAALIRLFGLKTGSARTFGEFCEGIYEYFDESGFNEVLYNRSEYYQSISDNETVQIYAQVYSKITEILSDCAEFLSDTIADIPDMIECLSYALCLAEISVIPSNLDEVRVGDVLRSRSGMTKYVFVLGANEGMLPDTPTAGGLLSENEKEFFVGNKINILSLAQYVKRKESFTAYAHICSAEKGVYISRFLSNGGESFAPSYIFEKIAAMFNIIDFTPQTDEVSVLYSRTASINKLCTEIKKLNEESTYIPDALGLSVLSHIQETNPMLFEKIKNAFEFKNEVAISDMSAYEKLFGDEFTTSISALQRYASCPFSYFGQYLLRPEIHRELSLKGYDRGSVLHEILNRFYSEHLLNKPLDNLNEAEIEKNIEIISREVFGSYCAGMLNNLPQKRFLRANISLNSSYVAKELVRQSGLSAFRPYLNEQTFGDNCLIPAIKLLTDSGKNVSLTGKIDRVDVYEKNNEKYFLVVDYKSGSAGAGDMDYTKLWNGLNLQLPVYAKSLSPLGSVKAVFYLHINKDIITKTQENQNTQKQITDAFKLSGVVVNDDEFINAIDNNAKTSSFIKGVKFDGKNDVFKDNKQLVSAEQLMLITEHADKKISSFADGILNAKMPIHPYLIKSETACARCSYSDICNFDSETQISAYNKINDISKEEYFAFAKEETQDKDLKKGCIR